MNGPDYLSVLQESVFAMMLTYSPVFATSGLILFGAFATIRVVNYLRKMGANAGGDHVNDFFDLMLEMGVGFMMIAFYQNPIPGVGISFSHLIVDQTQWLTRLLDADSLTTTYAAFDGIQNKFIEPALLDFVNGLIYFLITASLTLAKLVSLAVVAFGLIASAVCVLVGPIFVPFFILPWLNWLFWGWFKALLQYSFMPVIAAAFVLVGSRFVVAVLSSLPAGITSDMYMTYGVQVLVVAGTFVFGLLLIPSLTSSIFSGHGSQSAVDLVRSRW